MKSKKAQQYIDGFAKAGAHHFYEKDVVRAVEIAEEEIRDCVIGLKITDVDAPIFTHSKMFDKYFYYIKDMFIGAIDNPKTEQR